MESLYSQIMAETENYFATTLSQNRWEKLNAEEQKSLRELVVKHFTDEKTEVWAAAALALGRLAVFDRKAEALLQEYMITATNIHCLRHAFTAMGSYAAHIEEERQFVFLTKYRAFSCKADFALKELIEGIRGEWGDNNWDECLKEVGLRGTLTVALSEPNVAEVVRHYFASLVKDKIEVVSAPAKATISSLIQGLSERQLLKEEQDAQFQQVLLWSPTLKEWWHETQPLESLLAQRKEVLSKKPNPGLENNVKELESLQERIQTGPFPAFSEVLKAAGSSIEKLFAWKSRQEQLSVEDLEEWVIGSFVFAFPSLGNIVGEDFDSDAVLRYLLSKGEKQIAYVKNVPYVIGWQEASGSTQWVVMAEELIAAVQQGDIQHDRLHLGDFLVDIAYLMERLPESSKYKQVDLFDLVEKSGIVLPEYTDTVKQIREGRKEPPAHETACLVRRILNKFSPEQEWREQIQEDRNLPLLLQLIFDAQIGRAPSKREDRAYEYVLSEERKDRLLIEALKARIDDNPELSAMLIRMLKERFYRCLEAINESSASSADVKEQLEEESLRQFYTMVDILSGWNWRGTIYKDAAIILVRLFEKGLEHQELFQKLFYLLFYRYPETPILQTMRAYTSKNSALRALFDQAISLLKDFRAAEEPEYQLKDDKFDEL